MESSKETDLITARLPRPDTMKLQAAADRSGVTLNEFIVQAALEKADTLLDPERTIYFSQNDAAMLIKMLDNPRKPNAAMMKAYKRFKEMKNGSAGHTIEPAAQPEEL
ncbi:type II toxin-antitoxin system TacA family antitoxin [Massilia rubra]|uniref:DUF1778 domain-containing protein n=1 Tax=Massilia rubra TaxID=2607910 RepID=A0ABX0LRR0_9BURK|nr:DUF1778 domain-containing protein [Massilia rubra]NHZ37223.1 DUF1778 domain-containing protein [Massilia rubra]